MKNKGTPTSGSAKPPVDIALNLHSDNSTLDQGLKIHIVLAALTERISYQLADEFINHLGYRGV